MIKMRCVSVFFPMREAEKKARNSALLFFFARTVGGIPERFARCQNFGFIPRLYMMKP